MKPPTVEELRRIAEATRAVGNGGRHDTLIALALERWAEQIEQKHNFWSRRKARESGKGTT